MSTELWELSSHQSYWPLSGCICSRIIIIKTPVSFDICHPCACSPIVRLVIVISRVLKKYEHLERQRKGIPAGPNICLDPIPLSFIIPGLVPPCWMRVILSPFKRMQPVMYQCRYLLNQCYIDTYWVLNVILRLSQTLQPLCRTPRNYKLSPGLFPLAEWE